MARAPGLPRKAARTAGNKAERWEKGKRKVKGCRVDFKTGKFVWIKTGMGGSKGNSLSEDGWSDSEEGRVGREEDGSVGGFVQNHGHRSAGMPTEPNLRAVRALGREVAVAQYNACAGADQRPGPLRPDQLPPAIARDGAKIAAAAAPVVAARGGLSIGADPE